ncbi:MAG: anion permease [Anaerolineae bacterium]|nr:anion permease [Anaerolineae bacterium]
MTSIAPPTKKPGKDVLAPFSYDYLLRWLIPLAIGLFIWFIPPPEGVTQEAWHMLAIFVATIAGIIAKPLPMGAVAMIGITMTAVTQTISPTDALSGFGNTTIWLIVIAFFISRGFIKTGLGARIAYLFMTALGKKSLGLSYGLVASDLVLAPAIPSNTARAGGVVFPILTSIAKAYGSNPDDGTHRKLGAYLTKAAFQGTIITSAMFLTAMAANPLAAQLAADQGITITWGTWAIAALVPGIICLILIPLLLYKIYPPEIKETPAAAQIARDKLAEMGKMKGSEWIMLGAFFLLLVLWIFGPNRLGMDATTAALIGLAFLLLTTVLNWGDILNERGAWDTLVWFAALVMMATQLNKLGFIPWFSEQMGVMVEGYNWVPAFLVLSLVYFYSHYLFASNTAHVSAMYAPFLAVALVVGTPPLLAALVLAFFSNLFSSMTHYGTGPAPVLYGSGYVPMSDWWRLGLIISVINIVIWLGIGGVWWKILGLW